MPTQIINTASGTDFSSILIGILVNTSGVYTSGTSGGGGTGDVVGPASATNNAIAVYDGTTGKLIKNSSATFSAGVLAGVQTINYAGDLFINSTTNDIRMTAQDDILASGNSLTVKYDNNIQMYVPGDTYNAISASLIGVGLGKNVTFLDPTMTMVPQAAGKSEIGTTTLPFSGVTTNNYSTTVVSGTVTSATTTINWANGASQILSYSNGQPSGTTVLFSGMTAGSSYALQTTNNASGVSTITWPASVKWQQGATGTMTQTASAKDLFTFFSVDGTTSFGNYSNDYR